MTSDSKTSPSAVRYALWPKLMLAAAMLLAGILWIRSWLPQEEVAQQADPVPLPMVKTVPGAAVPPVLFHEPARPPALESAPVSVTALAPLPPTVGARTADVVPPAPPQAPFQAPAPDTQAAPAPVAEQAAPTPQPPAPLADSSPSAPELPPTESAPQPEVTPPAPPVTVQKQAAPETEAATTSAPGPSSRPPVRETAQQHRSRVTAEYEAVRKSVAEKRRQRWEQMRSRYPAGGPGWGYPYPAVPAYPYGGPPAPLPPWLRQHP